MVKVWLVLLLCGTISTRAAVNRFWVAAGPSNWNNVANWSNVSGGAGGFSVPGLGDNANFDGGGSGNCTIDLALSVASITVNAAYSGTILQGANSITTTGAATFGGGTFTGGSANITFGGAFTLSGTAIFTSTTALLEFQNNCAFTAGTFNHNNGSVQYNRAAATTISGGAENFFNLEFVGNGFAINITAGTLTVANTLTISGASFLTLNTGTINADGDITVTNSAIGGGGSALVNIVGAGTQNFTGGAAAGEGALPQVTINKPSGTLNLLNFPSVANNFTYSAGTVNAGTSTLCFSKATVSPYTLTGSLTINNILFTAAANFTATIAAGTVITCSGSMTIAGVANLTLNTGTINVAGDLILTNTAAGGGGSATINLDGASNQNIDGTAITGNECLLPILSLNSTSTISLLGNISLSGNLTYVSGTVVPGVSTVFVANTLTITGSFPVNNLTLNRGANQTVTVAAGSTVTVGNTFDMENGAFSLKVNTGTIAVQGNLTDNNTSLVGGGTGTFLINGSGAQTITSPGVLDEGRLPAVTINKVSGTLQFPALITVVGNWTYTAGTIDVTTNNSTVVFRNTLTISGTHTLNNVELAANANSTYSFSAGTVLTVAGTLTTNGASNITMNAAVAGTTVLQAQGDIVINNTGAGGGTAGILINGAGAQAFTSTAASGQGLMPYITIQKATGTLTLAGIISVSRNWTYSSGTVDATTNTTTVVFGGNNLAIASAGMSFYNVTVTSNTSTLTNSLTANGALSITGGALAPGANTINLAGNWSDYGTAGFTEATSTVVLNGGALQTITTPGGENYATLIINNTGAGVQLENNVTTATTLTMTQGNIDLNGNTFTLGLSAVNSGTLNYTAGNMINSGTLTRWLPVGTIATGSSAGLFPMGTATDGRPLYFSAPVAGPTTGGTISVSYTDAVTNTSVSISDPPDMIVLRKDLNWSVVTGNGLAGGTYDLQEQGTSYGLIGAVSDLRVSLANAEAGNAGVNSGTTADPQVNRTGLTMANLTNVFYLGSINSGSSPLPVVLVYFKAQASGQIVKLSWETAQEVNNDFFTVQRSKDGSSWSNLLVVAGKGTHSPSLYEAVDDNPFAGVSYYRLAQTDDNGRVTYSEVCVTDVQPGGTSIVVFPNPARDYVVVSSGVAGPLTIQVFDARGTVVVQPHSSNGGDVVVALDGLAGGVYFLKIQQGEKTEVRSILLTR